MRGLAFKATTPPMPPPLSPFQQGLAAASAGDFPRAYAIARALLARDPNDVHALQIVGFAAFRQGRNEEALQAFLRANRAEPGQPALLYWLGLVNLERGAFERAEKAFRNAVEINPKYGEAWCHLGETLFLLDRQEEARAAFEAAIAAEPASASVLARAARHFESTHDLARARDLASEAVRLAPSDEIAWIALIELDLREKRHADVIEKATERLALSDPRNFRNRSRLNHLLASALDRSGDHDRAFATYAEANRLQSLLGNDTARIALSPLQSEALDRLIRYLRAEDLSAWTHHNSLEGPTPVFLLGFVRSGTTWLDQILSSHPDVAVMEEEDNFADAWAELLVSDRGLARLASLTREDVNSFRARYWARARKTTAAASTDKMIVDKLPLNTVQLALIWRLFPEAKVLFALRDPRDAVLSAFQQHFQINTGMSYFLDIKTSAEFYDKVLTIGSLVRTKTPLAVHEVRYENVVADLQSEIRRALDFLELPWTDAVLNYQETAKQRAVRTPSRQQVVQSPYSTSIGKWRNYRAGMAPALPILAPWVRKFGYSSD